MTRTARSTVAVGIVGIGIVGIGAVVGAIALGIARRAGSAFWAGGPVTAQAVLLLTGLALVTAGQGLLRRSDDRTSGVLLTAAGFAWFVTPWNTQTVSSAVAFTAGLVFGTACPVLIGHGVLRYGRRRLDGLGRAAVGVGYAGTVVLGGIGAALLFDPAAVGCAACPRNLLLIHTAPATAEALRQLAIASGVVWCGLLLVAIGRRLLGADGPTRRRNLPVLLPAFGYSGVVGATYLFAIGDPFLPVDAAARAVWTTQAALVLAICLGTLWPAIDVRLTRARIARLVVEMTQAAPVGGLGGALAWTLGDPRLAVRYPADDDTLVDVSGSVAHPAVDQVSTRIVRGGQVLAVLDHRPGLLDDPELVRQLGDTARLVVDNEGLQARTRAQLVALQESRRRIVRSLDAERRRLERDLHDGAQQHLVALSLALQVSALRSADDERRAAELTRARTEVTQALRELRGLARGIYPRELADEGLAAALETLAEDADGPLIVEAAAPGRYPHAVEAAAYLLVARTVRMRPIGGASVLVTDDGRWLRLVVRAAAAPTDLTALEDRVGALGGRLVLTGNLSGVTMSAELPCEW